MVYSKHIVDPDWAAENDVSFVMVPVTASFIVAVSFVGLRMYCRVAVTRSFGSDDIYMLAATVLSLSGMIIFIGLVPLGLGRHQPVISYDHMYEFMKWNLALTLLPQTTGICLLEQSIGAALLRLSRGLWVKWTVYVLSTLIILSTIATWVTFLHICTPLVAKLDSRIKGQCMSPVLFRGLAVSNTFIVMVTNFVFATIPIYIVCNLKMSSRTRILLCFVYSTGYYAVLMGGFKAYFQLIFEQGKTDTTYHFDIQYWGYFQLNLGIVAACAPTLNPLISSSSDMTTTTALRRLAAVTARSRTRLAARRFVNSFGYGVDLDLFTDDHLEDYESGFAKENDLEMQLMGGGRSSSPTYPGFGTREGGAGDSGDSSSADPGFGTREGEAGSSSGDSSSSSSYSSPTDKTFGIQITDASTGRWAREVIELFPALSYGFVTASGAGWRDGSDNRSSDGQELILQGSIRGGTAERILKRWSENLSRLRG